MEFGTDKKIQVVWICHFTNSHIQSKLNVRKRMREMAPWITFSIEEAKKRNDIELHIISPHRWIIGKEEFVEDNVHFHFFNPGIPFIGRHWPRFFRFDFYTNYFFNRRKIKGFINRIKPDIINLHGAENPYYSSSILDISNIPVLVTIQGLKLLSSNKLSTRKFKSELKLEKKILMQFNHFGIRVKFLQEYIERFNKSATFHWFKYPFNVNIANSNTNIKKEIDLVYFARVSKDKGVEDLIHAIAIIKKELPNVTLSVIGSSNNGYIEVLQNMINNYNLNNNIKLLGFIEKRSEVHKIVLKSRIVVLPTYNDILPGSIIESLKIGVPVIAYAANGVVDFNANSDVIKLVTLGDIKELAISIIDLIGNPDEQNRMRSAGFKWIKEEANNEVEFEKLIEAYKYIIEKSAITKH